MLRSPHICSKRSENPPAPEREILELQSVEQSQWLLQPCCACFRESESAKPWIKTNGVGGENAARSVRFPSVSLSQGSGKFEVTRTGFQTCASSVDGGLCQDVKDNRCDKDEYTLRPCGITWSCVEGCPTVSCETFQKKTPLRPQGSTSLTSRASHEISEKEDVGRVWVTGCRLSCLETSITSEVHKSGHMTTGHSVET